MVSLLVISFTKKTTGLICTKFAVWLWYDVTKKRLTFGGDRKKDHDSAAGFQIQGWADGGGLHLY